MIANESATPATSVFKRCSVPKTRWTQLARTTRAKKPTTTDGHARQQLDRRLHDLARPLPGELGDVHRRGDAERHREEERDERDLQRADEERHDVVLRDLADRLPQ